MDRLDARIEALIKKYSTLRQSMRTLKSSMLKEAKSLNLDVLELDERITTQQREINKLFERMNHHEKILIMMLGLWVLSAIAVVVVV